jgi:hypothetical protein
VRRYAAWPLRLVARAIAPERTPAAAEVARGIAERPAAAEVARGIAERPAAAEVARGIAERPAPGRRRG